MADDAGGAPPLAPAGPPMEVPGPDISIAGRFVGVSTPLYIIAIVMVAVRLYNRIRNTSGNSSVLAEDVFAVLACIADSFQIGLLYAAIPHGFGRHNFYLRIDEQIEGMRLMQMSYLPWACGVAFGKISTICLLMRLKATWIWLFRSLIGMQVLGAIAIIIFMLVSCRPIEASWNPMVPGASCWNPIVFQASVYFMAATAIVTDIIFGAISTALLYKIRRPRHEKIIVIMLMN
ncbi:hypothetical protein QBC35DRAFT_230136 [Podospora australis]|uniref:Rhodopsin domain-containing protein n=1 Tax=Podospora australis TaxID=1536484 RepID=A0AAN6WKW1_9PEZI|nr:hypothetical protein QBC35DRAFT_230136 [Podospora australis]